MPHLPALAAALLLLAISQPSSAEEIPRVLGISHVAVKATDVEASVAFYRDFLGFAEQGRLNYLDSGALMLVYLKVSDEQWIEIFDAARTKPGADRLYQIALRVENADAVRAHLAAHGYENMLPATVPLGQMKNANFTVRAPHNYTVEVVQYMPNGRTLLDAGKFLSPARISHRIAHIGAVVDDVSAARHFYGDLLGFTESWRGSMDGRELSWIHMKMQESPDFVEWMLNPNVDPHFCLEVADAEAARAILEQSAYATIYAGRGKPLATKIGKNRRRQLNLWDPEGVRVELMEANTVDGQPVASSDARLPEFSPRP